MSKVLEVVKGTIKNYGGKKVNCPCASHGSDCDAMVLGSLIKSMVEDDAWPIPEPPYKDFTLAGFTLVFGVIDLNTLCSRFPAYCRRSSPKCRGVGDSIEKEVKAIVGEVTGLDIKNFKR
jgi:hypothetical protein